MLLLDSNWKILIINDFFKFLYIIFTFFIDFISEVRILNMNFMLQIKHTFIESRVLEKAPIYHWKQVLLMIN